MPAWLETALILGMVTLPTLIFAAAIIVVFTRQLGGHHG